MTFVLEQVLAGCCPKLSQLVLVILATFKILCKKKKLQNLD